MKGPGRNTRGDMEEKLRNGPPQGAYLFVLAEGNRYYRYECGKPVMVSAEEVAEVHRIMRERNAARSGRAGGA